MDREELGAPSRYPAALRRLLTVDEYHRMGEAGILTDDDRVELIEGELVAMAPIGSEHVAATNALTPPAGAGRWRPRDRFRAKPGPADAAQ